MEQINYEKKYKEALGRANAKIETYNHLGNASAVKSICEIFPELKDGEDEKIKTNIIKLLRFVRDTYHQYSDECDEAIAWVEKQSTPQVRKGNEWVNIIDDACEHRYAEEYAHGEYCHQQSFRWGFQEGVDWLEKQDQKKHEEELENAYKCADEVQYRKGYEDAKREFLKQDEQKPAWSEEDEKAINDIMWIIEAYRKNGFNETHIQIADSSENWLKSLKERMKGE